MRRLRKQPWLRELVQETRLHVSDLIWPVFVQEGKNQETPIATLPGVNRMTIDILIHKAREAAALGIPAIAIFPVTDTTLKNENSTEALNRENLICRALKEVKSAVPEIGLIADVALDPYTSHGHDGVLAADGDVDNDATLEILRAQAVLQAKAGADIIAPSDMMDGRIRAIREALDTEALSHIPILSYAAKYASAFYGPFRDAVGSNSDKGYTNKLTYQMHPANAGEAMQEIALDIEEGADMIMVKPALPYLDILQRSASTYPLPVFAYQVSGEYAALVFAAKAGALDYQKTMLESLTAIKRAGARGIFTYAAVEVARWLQEAA